MAEVPAVIDMQPVAPHNETAKGRVQMSENTLLMSADATSDAVAGPSDGIPAAAPEVPTWDPVERWRAQRKFAWVLLIDAAIYFVISMITFAIVNIVVSAAGLAAGIVWFVFFFLRFGTQSAIKAFYWPGLVGGVLATLCAIFDFVWAILKIVDSPVGGSLALPFRIVFIGFNAVMGACCLWIWYVGYQCKKCIEAQLAARGPGGMMDRARRFVSGLMPSRTTTAKALLQAHSTIAPSV